MKILFVVPYAPTLIRTRPYQLIRHLSQQGHEITLVTLWSLQDEKIALQELAQHCARVFIHNLPKWRIVKNLVGSAFTPWPYQSAHSWQPAMAASIQALLHNDTFDVVHVEHLRGVRYALAAKAVLTALQRTTPIVWDSVDCITYLFQQVVQHSRSRKGRLMAQLDLVRTRRYEGWLVPQFDRVLVTSAKEKQAMVELAHERSNVHTANVHTTNVHTINVHTNGGGKQFGQNGRPAKHDPGHAPDFDQRLEVITPGVDLAYFAPQPRLQKEADLVFTGKMSYHANITAALHLAQEIMPRVWQQRPDVTLWIVGAEPSAEIRALAAEHNSEKRLVVTGTVPDMRRFLQQATLAVAPILYGAGVQNKLLEAMACGTPVVTNPQAIVGLSPEVADHLVVADDAESFARAILQLLHDRPRRIALGEAGRCYVETHHAWPAITTHLVNVYQAAIAAKQGSIHAGSL